MAVERHLTPRQTLWLLCAASAAAAPLVPFAPAWVSALTGLALAWRGALLWRARPLPARWILALLAVTGAAGIGMHFHSLFGRDAGIAMLLVFLALKLLETRAARDAAALVLLCFFLVLGQFFYSQSMAAAATMVAVVLIITAALVNLGNDHRSPAATLRTAAFLLMQATPFMLLLFVLFPRVSGPLWGLPADAFQAVTGLSDTMSPGSISRLGQSDAIAFRAKFAAAPPAHAGLYWRGPVLSEFDGRTWRSKRGESSSAFPYRTAGEGIDYVVTLEANNRPWLFALELPISLPAEAVMTSDYTVLARSPVRSRQRYAMRSRLGLAAGSTDSPARLREALSLPARLGPRARRLAGELRAQSRGDADVIAAMLAYFRRNPFYYTLEPPLLGEDSIDQFLFDTRRGFCEHYAAAFVFVMRAAGIPARVVTGYQGGAINPVDGYLEVRQYDAHAWAEVWLPGLGWRRVDPTAAIAPARVEVDLAAAVPSTDPLPLLVRADLSWLRSMRYRLDALSNGWNQWVLGYNPQRQRDLLRTLGMASPDWQSMTAVLATLCGVLLLASAAWAIRQRRPVDPALAAWERFSAKLRRRGLARRPAEGPLAFARRIAAALPQRHSEIAAIAGLYAQLRYAGEDSPAALHELRQRVRQFQP